MRRALSEAVKAKFRRKWGIAPKGAGPHADSSYGLPLPPATHPLAVPFARAVLRRAPQATKFAQDDVDRQVRRAKRILQRKRREAIAVLRYLSSRKREGDGRTLPGLQRTIESAAADYRSATIRDFNRATNMGPDELERWLDSAHSKDAGTGVGHRSGRKIVKIKRKKNDDLNDADLRHMRKVSAYVARHKGEGPATDDQGELTPSAISLRNWGHDPLRATRESESLVVERPLRLRETMVGGVVPNVLLIRSGPGNKADRHFYSDDCLEKAAQSGIFEGARCYTDHPTPTQDREQPERSVKALAGWYSDVVAKPYRDPQLGVTTGLFATFHAAEGRDDIVDMIRTCSEYARKYPRKAYVGLSINAYGVGAPATIDGEQWNRVDEIVAVDSVDIVTRAGAGGTFLPLQESYRMATHRRTRVSKPTSRSQRATRERDVTLDEQKLDNGVAALRETALGKIVDELKTVKLADGKTLEITDDLKKQLTESLGRTIATSEIERVLEAATEMMDEADDDVDDEDDDSSRGGKSGNDDEDLDEVDDDAMEAMSKPQLMSMLKRERSARMMAEKRMERSTREAERATTRAGLIERERLANRVLEDERIPESFRPRLLGELLERDRNEKQMREHAKAFDLAFIRPTLTGVGATYEPGARSATAIDFTFGEN